MLVQSNHHKSNSLQDADPLGCVAKCAVMWSTRDTHGSTWHHKAKANGRRLPYCTRVFFSPRVKRVKRTRLAPSHMVQEPLGGGV